ncbi:questin oxidase family protein [Ideonella sp.]|uniref:questin oxidase family protein n=1 Tax=Ideonella sp. TaxID=1929293 RepID=UPI0035B425F4
MSAPATRSDLHRALDASLAYAATYPAGRLRLSNHLPMVLTALHRLQAPPSALQAQLQRHAARLDPLTPDSAEALAARQFAAELERNGLPAVLAQHLPGLLGAAETAAFHGLIRLAHALDADHPGEIAHALAAWQTHRQSIGPMLPATPTGQALRLADVLAALVEQPALAFTPQHDTTITQDMLQCAALPGFDAAVSGEASPSPAALTLESLAEASLAVYLGSRDFTALHLVTGCHALRQVLPHARLDAAQTQAVLHGVWRAWLAAWLSIGRPRPDWVAVYLGGPASEADWQAALPALAASRDDHRIKLAWTALDEWRHRGWPGYARVLPAAEATA